MSSNGLCGISGCWESTLTAGLSPRAAAGAARIVLAIDPSTVMHHCTLGDIAAQFCQGSLEYFFLITPAVGGRKWLPWGLFLLLFLFAGTVKLKEGTFNLRRNSLLCTCYGSNTHNNPPPEEICTTCQSTPFFIS